MALNVKQAALERRFRVAFALFAIVLVLAVYFMTNDPAGDIKRLITCWAAFALGLWWIAATWWFDLPVRRPGIFLELLLCLLAFLFIATLRSEFVAIGLIEVGGFFGLFMLYLVASQTFRSVEQVRRLMLVLCCAVAVASLYGFCQAIGLEPLPWGGRDTDVYTNLPATFGNPNFAAHTLVLTIIMGIFLALTGLRFAWVLVGISVMHLLLTHQRAGLVALAASSVLVLSALLVNRRIKGPVLGAVLSLALTGCIAVTALGGAMALTKARTGNPFPLDMSLLLRYQSYVSATDMVLERPLLGHGPGVYGITNPLYWTRYEQEWFAQKNRMNAHVHNDLLELAIDAGLPAAGLYLSLLVLGICYGLFMALSPGPKDRRRLGYAFAAIFCAFLVDGLFGFNLRVPVSAAIIFLMMGLLEGLWLRGAREGDAEVEPLSTASPLGLFAKTWRIVCFAVLVCFTVLSSCVFAAEYALAKGMRAWPDVDAVRALYRRAEALAPWSWRAAQNLGDLSHVRLDMAEAVSHYERALEKNPYDFSIRVDVAQSKMVVAQEKLASGDPVEAVEALNIFEEASKHLEWALDICPMYHAAEKDLGRIASICASYLAEATESGALSPDRRGAAVQEIAAYWAVAEDQLQRAIRHGTPNQSELYRLLGRKRMEQGNYDGAEEALVRAAQANPADAEIWPQFLQLAREQDRYDRARATLYTEINRMREMEQPNHQAVATAYVWLAKVLEDGFDDLDAADQAYLGAVRHQPLKSEVWASFARHAFAKGRQDALNEAIQKSCARLAKERRRPLAHVAAVNAVLEDGRSKLEPASVVLMVEVRAFRQSGTLDAAHTFGWAAQILYEAVVAAEEEGNPACLAYLNLGIVFAGIRDLSVADQLYAKAYACLEDDQLPTLAVHWADTLVLLDRYVEALDLLRDAVARDPEHLDARWALARTLARMGRYEEAGQEYDTLLAVQDLTREARADLERERDAL